MMRVHKRKKSSRIRGAKTCGWGYGKNSSIFPERFAARTLRCQNASLPERLRLSDDLGNLMGVLK